MSESLEGRTDGERLIALHAMLATYGKTFEAHVVEDHDALEQIKQDLKEIKEIVSRGKFLGSIFGRVLKWIAMVLAGTGGASYLFKLFQQIHG